MNNFIVNESCKNIRALALQTLRGKWAISIGVVFLSMMLVSVPAFLIEKLIEGEGNFEMLLIDAEAFLIGAPISLGLAYFMLSLFRNKEAKVSQLFEGFEQFVKVLLLMLVSTLFIILWTFCFIVPGIIAGIKYSQAVYILADNPSKGVMQCIEESKIMMRGNKWKYFSLHLSFIGWAVLAALTAGIGYLWLAPYVNVSRVAFYELVSGNLRPGILEENIYEE